LAAAGMTTPATCTLTPSTSVTTPRTSAATTARNLCGTFSAMRHNNGDAFELCTTEQFIVKGNKVRAAVDVCSLFLNDCC
jgi:hypothetical protein